MGKKASLEVYIPGVLHGVATAFAVYGIIGALMTNPGFAPWPGAIACTTIMCIILQKPKPPPPMSVIAGNLTMIPMIIDGLKITIASKLYFLIAGLLNGLYYNSIGVFPAFMGLLIGVVIPLGISMIGDFCSISVIKSWDNN